MGDDKCVLDLQARYQEILLNNGGLRTLCNTLKEEIKRSVFIMDPYRENLLYIDRELRKKKPDFYNYLNDRKIVNQRIRKSLCGEKINLKRCVYSWQGNKYKELEVKLGKEGNVLGILAIILENDKNLADEYCHAVMQAVYALSLKLHQNNLIQKLARKCSNELIEDILQDRINNKKELIKRSELAGWDLTVSYQLFVLRYEVKHSENSKKNNKRSLYTYELEEKIINSLHRIIRTTISRKYIIFSYDNDILLLINYSKPAQERYKDIETIFSRLKERFDVLKLYIGAGCYIEECTDISRSYKQGLYTLDFLATTNQSEEYFFYENLGSLKLLWQIEKDILRDFAYEYLNPILEYDFQNDNNFLETLGVFLQENNNFQEAAKRLHLHPNTIRYRIDKIQKMLDCDIKIFDNQVNLILAYKINKFILDEL